MEFHTSRIRWSEDPMTSRTVDAEALLTPAEVAALFRVDPKTVTRWAKAGKLTSLRTLGGHRSYRETEVRQLLGQAGVVPAPAATVA
jgi:excisionase family DNA binding protein